jgi:hypothetical protein
MLTRAVSQACTPTLTTMSSPRPLRSRGTSTSNDNPPAHRPSIRGETIARRGDGGCEVTVNPKAASGAGSVRRDRHRASRYRSADHSRSTSSGPTVCSSSPAGKLLDGLQQQPMLLGQERTVRGPCGFGSPAPAWPASWRDPREPGDRGAEHPATDGVHPIGGVEGQLPDGVAAGTRDATVPSRPEPADGADRGWSPCQAWPRGGRIVRAMRRRVGSMGWRSSRVGSSGRATPAISHRRPLMIQPSTSPRKASGRTDRTCGALVSPARSLGHSADGRSQVSSRPMPSGSERYTETLTPDRRRPTAESGSDHPANRDGEVGPGGIRNSQVIEPGMTRRRGEAPLLSHVLSPRWW